MRFARVIVFEGDGRVTAAMQPLAEQMGFSLRQVQQSQACWRALRPASPGVLLLRVGRDLEREFGLLDRVSRDLPRTRCVVLLDRDDVRLAALAWDLGAGYVMPLTRVRDLLADLVRGMLGGHD